MMIELTFRFDELAIDRTRLARILGYEAPEIPEPFLTYLDQAFQDCYSLSDIKVAYRIVDQVEILKNKLIADGLEFKVGKTILEELNGAEKLAFFVCTAGNMISEESAELLKGEDPVLGYVYDAMGSEIVEALSKKTLQIIREETRKDGLKVTNSYSPGYCHWSVADQHKLFAILGGKPCGVSLTESSLMYPVKSISGVIGIGKEVTFQDYQCSLCTLENCMYREMHTLS